MAPLLGSFNTGVGFLRVAPVLLCTRTDTNVPVLIY